MPKLEVGIQKNLIYTNSGTRGGVKLPRFDPRTIESVEKSRAPNNGKYFRTKQQRAAAHELAEKQTKGKFKGTWTHYGNGQQRSVV